MRFWEVVNREIKKQHIKQEWVAVQAGINYGTMKGWITHNRLPNVADAHKIACVLGVTVEYLLTGNNTDKSETIAEIKEYLSKINEKLEDIK